MENKSYSDFYEDSNLKDIFEKFKGKGVSLNEILDVYKQT